MTVVAMTAHPTRTRYLQQKAMVAKLAQLALAPVTVFVKMIKSSRSFFSSPKNMQKKKLIKVCLLSLNNR